MSPVTIRGFQNGVKVFEETVDADAVDLMALGEKHALRLVGELHMIEVEFLDEPDRMQRFLRFGTDTRGMRFPMAVKL